MRLPSGLSIIGSVATLAAMALAAPAHANTYQSLDLIDQAVAQFTGAGIGQAGGAQVPADRQLRLHPCSRSLMVNWHDSTHQAVRVTCPDVGGWRVFVPVMVNHQQVSREEAPIVSRRDLLRVEAGGAGFRVSRQGEALEAGRMGESIRVRIQDGSRGGRIVSARVIAAGLVLIPIR